ncbi:MAG: PDZ domain-containing protein [Acidimicrobiia bacterium]|nr:PDZ domain-containing protein [Acidimicrobiia bacterium]
MLDNIASQPLDRTVERRLPRWPFAIGSVLMVLAIFSVVLWNIELPYLAWSPGPTPEVVDLLTVEGAEQYAVEGDLYMLTVSQQDLNVYELLAAVADPQVDVLERTAVRPIDVTQEEYQRQSRERMDESKVAAISVALDRVGYDVTVEGDGVEVVSVLEGTPADGVLEAGDIITAINGKRVFVGTDAVAEISTYAIGDTITLTVSRGEDALDLVVTLTEHTQNKGQPMVGFGPLTYNPRFVFPIDVDIDSSNIGGPSAGMMYTLAIINVLTPEDLTHGLRIAGTGTISTNGDVGPIGGVRQKVVGAAKSGAQYILVPEANYEEALTAEIAGSEIVAVATIDDALDFLAGLEPAA